MITTAKLTAASSSAQSPVVGPLVDQVCSDLKGKVPRERVECVVLELFQRYCDASVTAYLPIFVRREARKHLCDELGVSPQGPMTACTVERITTLAPKA